MWSCRRQSWGLPALAVAVTISVWYVGDILYNDFAEYRSKIGENALDAAWWQVCGFIAAFSALTPTIANSIAGAPLPSQAVAILERRPLDHPAVQARIDTFAKSMMIAWVLLIFVAIVRVKFDFIGLFAPYVGRRPDPWMRNRLGGGIDSLLSLAAYIQIFLTTGFGVVLAIAKNSKIRLLALAICFLSFPYYIFDRTRNAMLAVIVPGFSAWVFGRVRGRLFTKIVLIAFGLLLTSVWFAFVMQNRSDVSIARAFASGRSLREAARTKHLGLNMLEELGWINRLIDSGAYRPNMGERYFAEIVNPIPRVLWPNKPMIGIDYAIARGQGGGSRSSAGVHATISTGLIGQGVVNFGPWFGPIASALLMAIWVGILARQDRLGANPARLMLYALGLILTFNMGRDITLLSLYPFIFGWIMVRHWERRESFKTSTVSLRN